MSVIKVNSLTVGYDRDTILEDVSFEVQEGEVFVILGGSGCGKSTLMKNMIGLLRPSSGSVFIDGDEITSAESDARVSILNKIGVMYQNGALFGSMSLIQNVMLPLEEFTKLPKSARKAIAEVKLRQVDLQGYEDFMPAEISGGMKKRAAIARAMALSPKIIFLDEPSAGLDPITSLALDNLIIGLSKNLGITFVVVTHELDSIFKIADRVIFLDKLTKGIIAEGDPRALKESTGNDFVKNFFNRTI